MRRRLGDVLNREDAAGILFVDDSRAPDPTGPDDRSDQSAGFAGVNLANVLFVIALEGDGAPPPDSFEWLQKRPEKVYVGVGPYEIVGDLHLAPGTGLRDMIGLARPTFIALAAAAIGVPGDPSSVEHYDVVFVNRRHIDVIGPSGPG